MTRESSKKYQQISNSLISTTFLLSIYSIKNEELIFLKRLHHDMELVKYIDLNQKHEENIC